MIDFKKIEELHELCIKTDDLYFQVLFGNQQNGHLVTLYKGEKIAFQSRRITYIKNKIESYIKPKKIKFKDGQRLWLTNWGRYPKEVFVYYNTDGKCCINFVDRHPIIPQHKFDLHNVSQEHLFESYEEAAEHIINVLSSPYK